MVFSPDGQRIVTASGDQTARVWNAASGQLLATLRGHTQGVNSAVFSPDSQRIVTASVDQTARVFRVVTLSQIAQLLAKLVRLLLSNLDWHNSRSGVPASCSSNLVRLCPESVTPVLLTPQSETAGQFLFLEHSHQ